MADHRLHSICNLDKCSFVYFSKHSFAECLSRNRDVVVAVNDGIALSLIFFSVVESAPLMIDNCPHSVCGLNEGFITRLDVFLGRRQLSKITCRFQFLYDYVEVFLTSTLVLCLLVV